MHSMTQIAQRLESPVQAGGLALLLLADWHAPLTLTSQEGKSEKKEKKEKKRDRSTTPPAEAGEEVAKAQTEKKVRAQGRGGGQGQEAEAPLPAHSSIRVQPLSLSSWGGVLRGNACGPYKLLLRERLLAMPRPI